MSTADIPEDANIAIMAPTDEAFTTLLSSLNISAAVALADTDLLTNLVKYHTTTYTDPNSNTLTTLTGDELKVLDADGKPSTIAAVAAASKGCIQGGSNTAQLTSDPAAVTCPQQKQDLWSIDTILIPADLAPTLGPQAAPATAPGKNTNSPTASSSPMPMQSTISMQSPTPTTPSSSANIASVALAAAVAVAAAIF